nr:hypothetical protein [Tanacetum cinerariifolium]
IDEADCDPEKEICLIKKLLYDNSSPRPPEEHISENSDAVIKSFSPSLILVEDSDSLIEEIDLSLTPDDLMPPGIENDDYDSKGDIFILEEFLNNDSLSLPENESLYFDISSSPRPPAKPPDDDEIVPNSGILTVKMEKSPDLLSHRGLKAFQLSSKSLMMIYGGNIPESDEFIMSSVENLVPNPSEFEDERECDVLICNDFTTFSNLLFDADNDFSSSDDESFSDEDISKEIYLDPLFDEEIISIKIDPHHFNVESDLIESLLNQ